MSNYIESGSLKIDKLMHDFVQDQVLPNLAISATDFWAGFEASLKILAPKNAALLVERERLQAKQDEWHKANPGPIQDFDAYKDFLNEIGYIDPTPSTFNISGENLDPEIAKVAGAQLVVPINNARYALNAANARWGSLYDALYGTDAIAPTEELSNSFDKMRGEKVIKWGREFLDQHFALDDGSHQGAKAYQIVDQKLVISQIDGGTAHLSNADQFVGYQGDAANPSGIVLVNNGLHIIIEINANHPIGKDDAAHVADIKMESAMSTIMDCEDSVAATNAFEKVGVYSNWLGLMQSNLEIKMQKNGKEMTRSLNGDIDYNDPSGNAQSLKGRSLMLIRNVGHLMTTDAILLDGAEIGEGLMDAFITSLISLHNQKSNNKGFQNSVHDSLYVVKPKMHGAKEVAFANETFKHVEALLGLAPNTIKVGIMDEERRTSVNLKACINEVKDRVFFINTGFLDRTGDEIHTCMHAGPIMLKGDIKGSTWIAAYEARNAQIGLNCGFNQKAQIGKGMWAMPDEMKAMMDQKIGHLKAGATTAWVPSPTAATLHATHYHQLNVSDVQQAMDSNETDINELLTIPVCSKDDLSASDVEQDLKLNCQGILGYVVRWVDQGVGCSKVPDLNDVGLMEDRATLRISSQHIANWLHHGVCTKDQVLSILEEMAAKVDEQNKDDPLYQKMSGNFDSSIAYEASVALIFEGMDQPSGYTEPLLHGKRRKLLDL